MGFIPYTILHKPYTKKNNNHFTKKIKIHPKINPPGFYDRGVNILRRNIISGDPV